MRSLLSIFLLFSVSANAATLYCGPSSTGSGSGADFNNRMALPNGTGFTRGNTYVVIEGSYGSKTLSTAASGTTQITIRLATTADSGVAGYATSLYDGQAVFGSITVATKYWVMNGTRRDESNGWAAPSGYGFAASSIGSDSSGGEDGSYSEFYYMDLGATYEANPSSGTIGGYGPIARFVYAATGIRLSRCALHNGSGALLLIPGSQNFIVEYCNFGPGWGKEAISCMNSSASGTTVRYCRFWDAALKDPTDGTTGTTAEIGMFDPYTTGVSYSNWKIYGNWFKSDRSTGRNAVIIIGGGGYPGTAANCLVYNNTIANMSEGGAYGMIVLVSGSGNEAKNNLFYNTPSSSVSANSTANNVTSSSNPFVGYSTQDYRIISTTGGTYPRNAGTALASTYNQDPLGVTRGADGTWDAGAFEYDTGAPADTNAPSVAITSHTNNQQVTTTSISVSGTASDDTSLSSVTLTNTTTSTGFTVSGTTSWSATATVQLGTNYLRAIATDSSGNKATNTVYVVLVDSTAPSVSITSPTNNQHTASSTGTVTGTASDNIALSSVAVTNITTGVRVTTTGTTSWSGTATYASGTNYIQAIATDTSGNKATNTVYIIYDPTAPSVAITSPTNYQLTASSSGTVTGTASDTYLNTVTLTNTTTGVRVTISGTTSWSGTASYTAGTNYLRAIATDLAGNRATNTVYTYYDAVAPTVTAFVIPSTSQSLTVPITTFTASDNTSVAAYLVNTSSSTPSAGDAGWSATPQTEYVFSTAGNKTLYGWAKDAVGRISSSVSDTAIVDLTNPTATIQTPTSGETYSVTAPTIDLTGVASDVNLYTVEWSNDRGGSGSTAGTTSWSKSGITLQTGANVLTITATDITGRTGTDTLTVTYSVVPTNRIGRATHLRVGTLR